MLQVYNKCNMLIETKPVNRIRGSVNNKADSDENLNKHAKMCQKCICKAKISFKKKKVKELRNASNNPKEYWKLLEYKDKGSAVEASINDLVQHFKEINEKLPGDGDELDEAVNSNNFDLSILDSPFSE